MSKPKMKKEHDRHFDMEGAQGAYRIAKAGLSDEMLNRIRGYAEGGGVEMPPDAGYVDPMALPPRQGFEVGFLLTEGGARIPIPVTPESGVGTIVAPGEAPQPLQGGDPMRRDEPMRLDTSGPGLADKVVQAQKEHLAELRAAPDPRQGAVDFQKKKEELGVVPKDSPKGIELTIGEPIITPAPAAPAPAPKPGGGGGGGGLPGTKDFTAGMAQVQSGINAEAEAQKAKAVATVNALDAAQKQAQANALEAKKRTDAAMQQSQKRMADLDGAIAEMKNINTTVDPGRYWASRSTGQRILGIFGLALGALGAGRDGINRAAMMLQQAIDRDVEAQKAEIQARLAKGRGAVEGAQSAYAAAHQIFQDEVAATNAAKAASWELADNELKKISAGSMGPEAQARAAQLSGEIQAKVGQYKRDTANMAFDNETQRIMRAAAAAGAGSTPEQRNAVATSRDKAMQITNNARELEDLVNKYGTDETLTPGVAEHMDLLTASLAKDLASMTDPKTGVRDAEMEQMAKVIFKRGYFQRDASAKAALQNLRNYATKRYLTDVQATVP